MLSEDILILIATVIIQLAGYGWAQVVVLQNRWQPYPMWWVRFNNSGTFGRLWWEKVLIAVFFVPASFLFLSYASFGGFGYSWGVDSATKTLDRLDEANRLEKKLKKAKKAKRAP